MPFIEPMNVCKALADTGIDKAMQVARDAGFQYLWHRGSLYHVGTGMKVS